MAELVELIVGKYDGSLKAEHGTGINMAPYVEREWGEKATELMWRVKRLADPDGVLSPRRRPQPRPRRPPAQPENDAGDRGVGDDLRRVRLLRAGLPEPQPDDDAAPADRPAARDGAPAARARRCSGRCSRSTSTTRSRPAPPTAPASSPARSGSTPGSWSRSCAPSAARRAGRTAALAAAKRWEAVERRLAGWRCGSAGRWRGGPSAGRALPGAAASAESVTLAGQLPAGGRRPPSTSPPAPTASSAADVAECTNRISAATRGRGAGRRSRRGPGCRSGFPRTWPAAAAGCPGARKGSRAAHRHKANEMVERLWALERGGGAAGRGRRRLLHAGRSPTRARACSSEENAERLGKLEILDSVAWAHDRLLPRLEIDAQGRLGHRPPDLRHPPHGPRAPRCARSPARSPRTSTSPPRRPAAASPATAASPTPS